MYNINNEKIATEIMLVTTKPSAWSQTNEGSKACFGESSLKLKNPCFIVQGSKCLKGKCQQLSHGFDLRKIGIDLTRYFYSGEFIYIIRMRKRDNLSATKTKFEISEAEIRFRCQ